MNLLRLLSAYFWVGVIGETAYRVNFFFQAFQSIVSLGVAVTGIAVIFSYTDSLAGWTPYEILALVGIYILIGGVIGVVIQPGMEAMIASVRDGTLDFTLTKPEDAQLLVSIQAINVWSFLDVVLGVGVLVTSLFLLGEKVGAVQSGEFILMLVSGAFIVYSFFLILATLSFWFVRVENILTIFQSMYEAGRWPISLYPGWLRYGLTFVIPVAFATSVPAEALTSRLGWATLVGAPALALCLVVLSRIIWRIGLRHYSGTSA